MKDLFEVEASIIGAAIDRPEVFLKLSEKLSAGDFSPQARVIFTTIKELFSKTGRIDFPSVLNKLNKKIDPALLKAIAEYGAFSIDIDNAIDILKKASLKRHLESALSRALTQLSHDTEPEDAAKSLEEAICQILTKKSTYSPQIGDLLTEYELFARQLKRHPWMPLPFKQLQDAVAGIIPGTFWILGGYTSRGKTSTVVEIAMYLLKKDAVVVHFSLEEERRITVARYLANLTGIPIIAQLKGSLKPEAAQALDNAKSYLSTRALYIYDDVFDLGDLYFKSQFVRTKEGKIHLIIVDYVQLVRVNGSRNLTERMDTAATTLRELSKKMGTTVVAISQIGREYTKDSSAIGFKGSGGLEAACDVALWIDPVPGKPQQFYLKLKKQRLGPTGLFLMEFTNTFTSVREVNNGQNPTFPDDDPEELQEIDDCDIL